jgi:hypothetical protein
MRMERYFEESLRGTHYNSGGHCKTCSLSVMVLSRTSPWPCDPYVKQQSAEVFETWKTLVADGTDRFEALRIAKNLEDES